MSGVQEALDGFSALLTRPDEMRVAPRAGKPKYYKDTPETHLAYDNNESRRFQDFMTSYRHGCVDCWKEYGGDYLADMELGPFRFLVPKLRCSLQQDHKDPSTKYFEINGANFQTYYSCGNDFTREVFLTELAKCSPRCKPCHAKRTGRQRSNGEISSEIAREAKKKFYAYLRQNWLELTPTIRKQLIDVGEGIV